MVANYNHKLISLTGRATNFAWPEFRSPEFSSEPLIPANAAAQKIRSLLCLDQPYVDYYPILALACMSCLPEIVAEFNTELISYDLRFFRLPDFTVRGAVLTTSQSGPVSIYREISEWPVNFNITLTYMADDTALCAYKNTAITVKVYWFANSSRLRVVWPDDIKIVGEFTGLTWSSGTSITIYHNPVVKDYSIPLQAIRDTSELQTILISNNTAGTYASLELPVEKLAIAYLALAESILFTPAP